MHAPSTAGRRRLLQAALGCGVLAAAPVRAQAAVPRVALVIANAAYASAPLPNAARDGQAMAALLQGMGFQVVDLRDASRQAMQAGIARARELLQGREGVGLLYYAGHGLQMDWRNYLLPVDAQPQSAADVAAQAVDIQAVIDAFQAAGTRMNILMLDACRDNPFGRTASGRGLAPLDAPPGTFLAYATAPGAVAEDGTESEGNGLYTRFLLRELPRAGARIEDVFKRVRLHVRQASKGRQIPWESTSLLEDFIFATAQPAPPEADGRVAFAEELAAWNRIKDSARPEDFIALLQRYPSGRLAELAQFRLDQLSAPLVRPATGPDGLVHLPSGKRRFYEGDMVERVVLNRLTGFRSRITLRVTAADEREVSVNYRRALLDQMGGLLRDSYGTRMPAMLEVPADLSLGKRWRTAFRNRLPNGQLEDSEVDFRVTGIDWVEVPAGRFRCYRIEGHGASSGLTHTSQWDSIKWVDPSTMLVMKQSDVIKDTNGSTVLDNEFELSVVSLVPRP